MVPKGGEIIDYLISIGYERILINESSGKVIPTSTITFITTLHKDDIKISLNMMTGSDFIICKGGEKIFDINEVTRKIFPLKVGSEEKIRSKGISHPISLDEVRMSLQTLKLDDLLNE